MQVADSSNRTTVADAKRAKFCQVFARTGNQLQAVQEAGFTGKKSSLEVKASKLLAEPEVQAELARLRAELDKTTIADLQTCCEVLTGQIKGDIAEYWQFSPNGSWLGVDMKRLKEDHKAYLLEEISITKDGVKFKWAKPRASIETLAKLLGWVKENGNHTTINLAEQIITVLNEKQGSDPRAG